MLVGTLTATGNEWYKFYLALFCGSALLSTANSLDMKTIVGALGSEVQVTKSARRKIGKKMLSEAEKTWCARKDMQTTITQDLWSVLPSLSCCDCLGKEWKVCAVLHISLSALWEASCRGLGRWSTTMSGRWQVQQGKWFVHLEKTHNAVNTPHSGNSV